MRYIMEYTELHNSSNMLRPKRNSHHIASSVMVLLTTIIYLRRISLILAKRPLHLPETLITQFTYALMFQWTRPSFSLYNSYSMNWLTTFLHSHCTQKNTIRARLIEKKAYKWNVKPGQYCIKTEILATRGTLTSETPSDMKNTGTFFWIIIGNVDLLLIQLVNCRQLHSGKYPYSDHFICT